MAYCSEEDVLQMIPAGELAQLSAETGSLPDAEVVAAAIGKAEGELDSYLGVRYVVPLAPTPTRVKALAVDLAIYHLYSRRSLIPGVRRDRYEAALAWLKQVARGGVVLAGAGGEPATQSREVAEVGSSVRVFSRDGLADW